MSYIDTDVIYPQIRNNPSSIYSFLLVAGYLKVLKMDLAFNGDFICELALPNKEIAYVYNKEILQKLNPIIPQVTAISIQESLYAGNIYLLQKHLARLLIQSVSCYDTELKEKGIDKMLKYGVAFSGKNVEVAMGYVNRFMK